MVTAIRKILNTGTNKFENAVNQMEELIYSSNQYISLNSNTFTDVPQNDLESLNDFWLSACYFQRVTRDDYRLCFPRKDWQKSTVYARYDSQTGPETQNCFIFDPTIGDGVLFLCVGNNSSNRTDIATASVYKPSTGYTSVADLPTAVIEQEDGYSWIALAQSDNRFTDSNWITLEIRNRINFFAADRGNFVDDGLTLGPFKTAVSDPFQPLGTGAAKFYGVENYYNQTTPSEITAGNVLYEFGDIKRYDVFKLQQALRMSGINTQIRFGGTGSTLGDLPSSIVPTTLSAQIQGSPFSDSSPLGWYNEKATAWSNKAGSVEMVYIDPKAGGLKDSDFTVAGVTAPKITVFANGTKPTVEFDLTKIKEDVWYIRGVKIAKDLATNERLVGKNNSKVEFTVSNTNNNYGFGRSLKALITPYNGLLTEQNLYGPIIPVNAFMTSVTAKESEIETTLKQNYPSFGGPTPTSFDSYAIISEPTNKTNNRELGLDLPPNTQDRKSNLVYATLTHAAGKRARVGAKIFTGTPVIDAQTGEITLVIGDVVGVVQATDLGTTSTDILFTTTNRKVFATGATIAIEEPNTGSFTATVTAKGQGEVTELSGTVTHIGNSNFTLGGTTADKRISIKYITRV
jgi:hypothetical protein